MTTNNNNVKTITNELSFDLKQEIVELVGKYKKRDIKKLETLYGDRNVDLYKHETIKEIMTKELELEDYRQHMVVYNQLSKVMDNSMFSNIVTNGDESRKISNYIKQLKKDVGFLEEYEYDIKLNESEYLSDNFYKFIDTKWGITLDNINDPSIPLKLLIDSPMGSGKSTMLGMMRNIVILKDTITLVENSVEDLKKIFPNKKIYCEHGSSKHKGTFEDGSIIVSTYNQIVSLDSKLGEDWLFILDEEHKLVVDISYKQDVLKEIVYVLLNKRGRYISMSGTPLKYGPLKYDQVVRVSKESNKKKVLELLDKDSTLEGRLYDLLEGKVSYEVK
jgi:Type III restriction enzyme, res subunit